VNTAIRLADLPRETLVIYDNRGWWLWRGQHIHSQQTIKIVPWNNRN